MFFFLLKWLSFVLEMIDREQEDYLVLGLLGLFYFYGPSLILTESLRSLTELFHLNGL